MTCSRCGKCCFYQIPGMDKPKKCKYLIIPDTANAPASCRIYQNRYGHVIDIIDGIKIFCVIRNEQFVIHNGKREILKIEGCTQIL